MPYNPETLLLRGASPHGHSEGQHQRMVAKTEPSFSVCVDKDNSEMEGYMRTHVVRRLEANNMNHDHQPQPVEQSRHLHANRVQARARLCLERAHLPADPESSNVLYDTLLEKYMYRREDLNVLLYSEWAGNYIITTQQAPAREDDEATTTTCS